MNKEEAMLSAERFVNAQCDAWKWLDSRVTIGSLCTVIGFVSTIGIPREFCNKSSEHEDAANCLASELLTEWHDFEVLFEYLHNDRKSRQAQLQVEMKAARAHYMLDYVGCRAVGMSPDEARHSGMHAAIKYIRS